MTTTYNESVLELLQTVGLNESTDNPALRNLHAGDNRYARDLKVNLKNVLAGEHLQEKEAALLALSVAVNQNNSPLTEYFTHLAAEKGANEAETSEAVSIASLLASNNILYRFRHFMDKEKYEQMPARIKMNIMMSPVTGKEFFELASLAVSAVNGCERCVRSHEKSLTDLGTKEERIFEAIRLAAIITGLTKVIY